MGFIFLFILFSNFVCTGKVESTLSVGWRYHNNTTQKHNIKTQHTKTQKHTNKQTQQHNTGCKNIITIKKKSVLFLCVYTSKILNSLVKVNVTHIEGRLFTLCYLSIIKSYPRAIFLQLLVRT
jgi:hypothetical protein